jgi:hypothetical protein
MSGESFPSFLCGALDFDRRVDVRYEYDPGRADRAVHGDEGSTCPAHVRNVSAGGLAFETDRWIEPSTLLSVELPSTDEAGTRRLVMRVRSAEQVAAGRWLLGCAFSRRLSSVELLALL